MSTILKALKKSEAERAGTLDTPALEPAADTGPGRWGLVAIIVPMVLISAVAAWVLGRSDGPGAQEANGARTSAATPAEVTAPALPDATAATPSAIEVEPPAGARAATQADIGAVNPQLPTAMSEPPVTSGPLMQMQAPRDGDPPPEQAAAPVVIDPAIIAARARAQLEADPPRLSSAPVARAVATPAPATRPEPVPDAGAPPTPVPVEVAVGTRAPVEPEPRRRPTRSPAEDLPTIYALPAGAARTRFEELRLNMHVYAEDPAERFVLVNLRRHVEGDRLGAGLVIDGIRPEGVVVRADGTRWLWTPR
ncbi:MAG: general secretion pathway protein GspB [Pseudomonadota bacterium]